MTSQALQNQKKVVRDLYEVCLNEGRLDMLPTLIAADFVAEGGARGPAGFSATVIALRDAFPDIHYEIEELLAEDTRVAVRWTWTGTHEKQFRNVAATRRSVTNAGVAIFELKAEKIVRAWVQTDRLGFLQALGVVAPDVGGPPARNIDAARIR